MAGNIHTGTAPIEQVRDLDADLAICEAATPGPWEWTWNGLCLSFKGAVDSGNYVAWLQNSGGPGDADRKLIAAARVGWPYAIRRAMQAEVRVDKLENELRLLQDQLNSRRGCWD